MTKKTKLIIFVLLLAALLLGAVLYGAMPEESIENAGTSQNAVVKQTALTYEGVEYPIKSHIQTVLLIGTDSDEQYQKKENSLQDYYNYNQADFLMLLVLDRDAGTAQLIQLNRDTMTDVPKLDVLGSYSGTDFKQICLAYNYGDGGSESCKNTMLAASWLLMDAPIQHYIQIPMSAISVVNDLVGGVSVTFPEDFTEIDPAFVQGATVRLTGEQAHRFVRARMSLADDTNIARMRRQEIYLNSLQSSAKEAFNADSEFAVKVVEKLADHIQSDMTAQQLSELLEQLDKYEISPICTPQGELVRGEKYYEFYVDEASLWEAVKAAFCQDART